MNKKTTLIFKDKHTSEFFQMNNDAIEDPSLSWAAKGLLAFFLSLPDNFEIHLRHLFTKCASGRRPTEAAMNELIEAGYVVKEKGPKKSWETTYKVYETPRRL